MAKNISQIPWCNDRFEVIHIWHSTLQCPIWTVDETKESISKALSSITSVPDTDRTLLSAKLD